MNPSQQLELKTLIDKFSNGEGIFPTPVPGITLIKYTALHSFMPMVYDPSLCLVVQGRKEVLLEKERFRYTPANYSLISVDLPVVGQVTEASPEKPYLCLKIDLNQRDFSELLADTGQLNVPDLSTRRGYFVGKVDDALTDSILRLARLMEAPQDIPLLGPLTLREVYYRLLKSDCAPMIAQLVVNGSNLQRISSAIEKLKTGYQEPVRVGELAGMVGMSVSSFHFHFKEITAMSPLQYQKRLRLMEARRLMMVEAVDAAGAAYRVGYESPSQFSREYARMFGNPPARDIKVLRSVAADA